MAETIVLLAAGTLLYIYLGYPAALYALSKTAPNPVRKDMHRPAVTILIAAYNEENCIAQTLQNKLALDYPADRMEIIVISDGSTDRTDEIVRSFEPEGVRLMRQEPRAGKTAALNRAIVEASGEIIIFSDANSLYEQKAIAMLVENFGDPSVGYVTGKMVYVSSDGAVIGEGCSAYMRYENFLRQCETSIGSVVGVDGGIDAVRKKLYRAMRPDQLPDFVLPLTVVEQGYRVVYEPRALLQEEALSRAEDEYRMRVRVSLRALWALFEMRHLLNPYRSALFAWQLFSHKWLRYGAFIFMAVFFCASLFAEQKALLVSAQVLFYGCGAVALVLEKSRREMGVLYYPYYFLLLNIACAHAFLKFLMGRRQVLWAPRKG